MDDRHKVATCAMLRRCWNTPTCIARVQNRTCCQPLGVLLIMDMQIRRPSDAGRELSRSGHLDFSSKET